MLSPGTRFGPYEIVAPIDAGGMGEVYRARDSRLQRTVALKVLSGKLASTPQLLARFEQEARAIAALQDPHICVLYDIGHEDDAPYLVMEFLEGETLAARLRRGALPLAEVVSIGAAMAEALERAHRAGIVHRDLKPGNVMLTKAGAKLLDFGLAKSAASSVFDATTLLSGAATPVTQPGAVLGTFAYMSPEQMEGREADARSDIYALGCVLYEMATGKPAHMGLQTVAPPALERLVRACLERDPEARVQSAHDAAIMLRGVEAAALALRPARGGWQRWLGWAVAALIAIAAVSAWQLRTPAAPSAVVAQIAPPPETHFVFSNNYPGTPVVSPDGRYVAFTAESSSGSTALWLRPLDQLQVRELPGTEGGYMPFWSPDSRSLGYFSGATLMVAGINGGLPRVLTSSGTARGGSWSLAGTIVFSPSTTSGLFRVPAVGGAAQPVTPVPAAPFSSYRFPYFLPGGKNLIYLAISPSNPDDDMLYFASLDGKVLRPLVHAQTGGIYAHGKLLYSVNGTLMAQPMSAADGTLSGTAQTVAGGIFEDAVTWRPAYSASAGGTLVYAAGAAGREQLAWIDRNGKSDGAPLPPFQGVVVAASIAPNGRRMAIALDTGIQDIWTSNLDGSSPTRLTFGPVINEGPVWSPDSQWIAYTTILSNGAGRLVRRPATGGAEQIISARLAGVEAEAAGWTVGGQILAIHLDRTGIRAGLAAISMAGNAARTIAQPRGLAIAGKGVQDGNLGLSPDGRWISYLAGSTGQAPNIYVIPFQGAAGSVWQVTSGGAVGAFWAKGGRELDVVDDSDRLLAIPVSVSGDTPVFGTPQVLATHVPAVIAASPDGQRFLTLTHPDDSQRVVIMTGWNR